MPTFPLTAAMVERLWRHPRRTPDRVEYWDAKTPGLCLRVSAGGAASWSFRYRPRNGAGYQRVTLGTLPAVGLADARDRAMRVRLEVTGGGDPQRELMAKRAAAANVLTFDEVAELYLEQYARRHKSSWKNDESYLKRPRKAWGDRAVGSITDDDAAALLEYIATSAPVSANRTQAVLHKLFVWAKEAPRKFVTINPLADMRRRGGKETPKSRYLFNDEFRALWHALDHPEFPAERPVAMALQALLLTGQRPGEVVGARQSELVDLGNPKKARWEIPAQRTKARREHVVPLAPMARELFRAAIAAGQNNRAGVFGSRFNNRDTLARHSLSRALQRAIAQVGRGTPASLTENPPTPHDLRRTVATGMAELGIPREDRLAVLAHVAGDVHGKVYDKYERLKEKRAALEKWERHIAALIDLPVRGGRP
jgi:integrase